VRLYFPVARRAADGVVAEPRRRRILVVDDDAEIREQLVAQRRSLGSVVMDAADAPAGLEVLKREEPFDLVLSDIVMPWPMDGRELADAIRRRWAGTAVVLMSGYSENALLKHGLLEAGAAWLAKPFRKVDLARTVAQALGTADGLTES
jgi:CheY-like chemotaxis protein